MASTAQHSTAEHMKEVDKTMCCGETGETAERESAGQLRGGAGGGLSSSSVRQQCSHSVSWPPISPVGDARTKELLLGGSSNPANNYSVPPQAGRECPMRTPAVGSGGNQS